jgi:mycofactocin system glycosyltransferase
VSLQKSVTRHPAVRPDNGLPNGFEIVIDADTKQLGEATLFGGSPARVLRLSPAGVQAWAELNRGPVRSAGAALLARRLTDAGLAHPRPPALPTAPDVTVLIPVHNRLGLLERTLSRLGATHPVLLVDDGSADPGAVAGLAARHAASVIRRPVSGGPGAARNTGLARIDTDVVAFLDSDCLPAPGWIEELAAQLSDPMVAAAAPRVLAVPAANSVGRYSAVRGSLDLGPRAARVAAGTRVAYVPSAALVVRRAALLEVARAGAIFDPGLRYGEDVDLIWRLDAAGWRVRYDPAVVVRHHEPQHWADLLARRYRYGTSAAPLARRHPTAMAPLVIAPLPALTVAAGLARRPQLAALAALGAGATMAAGLRSAGLPMSATANATGTGVHQTWLGLGRYGTQFAAPLLLAAFVLGRSGRPGRSGRSARPGRRLAVASLLLGGPLTAWIRNRPELGAIQFSLAHVADDVAYGAGVHAGCLREGSWVPLRPRLSWRPIRRHSISTKGSTDG